MCVNIHIITHTEGESINVMLQMTVCGWTTLAPFCQLHLVSSILSPKAYSLPFHPLNFMELPALFFGLKVPSQLRGY